MEDGRIWFDLAPYAIKEQALAVRMITNGRRSDEGLDVVMWDPVNKKLIPMHDNDTVNMDAIGSDTLLTQQTRQVRIFLQNQSQVIVLQMVV